jgi:hypothetical protein
VFRSREIVKDNALSWANDHVKALVKVSIWKNLEYENGKAVNPSTRSTRQIKA